jgi:hypothetical protein
LAFQFCCHGLPAPLPWEADVATSFKQCCCRQHAALLTVVLPEACGVADGGAAGGRPRWSTVCRRWSAKRLCCEGHGTCCVAPVSAASRRRSFIAGSGWSPIELRVVAGKLRAEVVLLEEKGIFFCGLVWSKVGVGPSLSGSKGHVSSSRGGGSGLMIPGDAQHGPFGINQLRDHKYGVIYVNRLPVTKRCFIEARPLSLSLLLSK